MKLRHTFADDGRIAQPRRDRPERRAVERRPFLQTHGVAFLPQKMKRIRAGAGDQIDDAAVTHLAEHDRVKAVGKGFPEAHQHVRQAARDLMRIDLNFRVRRAEVIGAGLRKGTLVELALIVAVAEGEGRNGLAAHLHREGEEGLGIDAARQQKPGVLAHAALDGRRQKRGIFRDHAFHIEIEMRLAGALPIALEARAHPGLHAHDRCSRHAPHIPEEGQRRRHEAAREIKVEGRRVHVMGDTRIEHRGEIGGHDEIAICLGDKHLGVAHVVAHDEQLFAARIPQEDGRRHIEMGKEVRASRAVRRQDRRGDIVRRTKDRIGVVDLAVDQNERAVGPVRLKDRRIGMGRIGNAKAERLENLFVRERMTGRGEPHAEYRGKARAGAVVHGRGGYGAVHRPMLGHVFSSFVCPLSALGGFVNGRTGFGPRVTLR